jgi:carboxyl-terminal processing protease
MTVTTRSPQATLPYERIDEQHMRRLWVYSPRSLPRAGLLLAAALCALISLAPSYAQQMTRSTEQVEIAPAALPAEPLTNVLMEGDRLESLRRWGEALSHYEAALRDYPGNETLSRREDLAKLHFSLDRRYADNSYLESLRTLTPQQTVGLYLELLRKIGTHYVTTPPWQKLAARGVTAVDLALLDATFCRANSLHLTAEQLAPARQELYQLMTQRVVTGPDDLSALAAEAARVVEVRCGMPQTASLLEFVAAAAGGLDEYSAYLTGDQLREVYQQIEGNFVGLGVELKADNGALLIVHVIPGSPAHRAGILDGDRIVAVDGRTTSELSTDEAASLLSGEEGTVVRVTTQRAGEAQPRIMTVRREHVEVPSLEDVRIVDADFGVAYIRIPTFQKTTARDLEKALWDLNEQKMKSLILDLRGNPGGLLTSAVEVADKFLQNGGIVSTRGRSAQEDFNYQAHYGGTWRVPLVVLIDRDSASASEIFAGAILDNNRGDLVGERSYGKGSVQGIFPLGYGGAGVRLTTALFYSPSGQKISHHGVMPNLEVRTSAKLGSNVSDLRIVNDDPVLRAGVEAARRKVAAPIQTSSAR